MTIQELYEQLSPIVQKFYDETTLDSDPPIHAANTIANYFMGTLILAVDNRPQQLMSLGMVVGLHMLPEVWTHLKKFDSDKA